MIRCDTYDEPICPHSRRAPPPVLMRREIPLHMLEVSRQIYHEAVLKPFTQVSFHFRTGRHELRELRMLLKILVPAQAKAIARFYGTVYDGTFTTPSLLGKFDGLKHVDLHIILSPVMETDHPEVEDSALYDLHTLANNPAFRALADIELKFFRITVSLAGKRCSDNLKDRLSEWVQRHQDQILPLQQPVLTADSEQSRRR